MSNSNQPNNNKLCWKLNFALLALFLLILLYFILPINNELIKNIIGGLICALIIFLITSIPEAANSSVIAVISQIKEDLSTDIKTQLHEFLIKVREEREQTDEKLIQSLVVMNSNG